MSYPITDIGGIDDDVAKALKSAGIRSTAKLLETARTVKGRKILSEKTGFAVEYIIDSANGNRPITRDETQKILEALTSLD